MLEPLAFAPTPTLVTLLNDFVQNHVFVDDEDEEKDDHSKIQELHKRRNFLASFSKLIIYNVLPTKHGADVFKRAKLKEDLLRLATKQNFSRFFYLYIFPSILTSCK